MPRSKREDKAPENKRASMVPKVGSNPYGTRSQKTISEVQHKAALELGDLQSERQGGGGLGIPGERKWNAVKGYSVMPWRRSKLPELTAIMATSKKIRLDQLPIEEQRVLASSFNRRVSYPGSPIKKSGLHSLHVANDIAAVYNSESKSKVYDYPDLAPKLDARLWAESRRSKGGEERNYFDPRVAVSDRFEHVTTGMRHLIAGKATQGMAEFSAAGANARGNKWLQKFSTILLAERTREIAHGHEHKEVVSDALTHVAVNRSFNEVFVTNAKTLAPFAQRGGAKKL